MLDIIVARSLTLLASLTFSPLHKVSLLLLDLLVLLSILVAQMTVNGKWGE